jgi:hypothetical protein
MTTWSAENGVTRWNALHLAVYKLTLTSVLPESSVIASYFPLDLEAP